MKQIRIPDPPTRPRERVVLDLSIDDAIELYIILGRSMTVNDDSYSLPYRVRKEMRLEGINR